jgi:leader peptidase (prepilin peptidase)/N-methyltransferase
VDSLAFLGAQPAIFISLVFVLGLLVGSFLNVVIYRLPQMLQRDWRQQCADLLGQETESTPQKYNLLVPRSACPHCGHVIGAMENIPVLSYLALGGRCSSCKARISKRYPLVELFTAVVSAVVAWRYGAGWVCLFALLVSWSLIALAAIDLDHKLLPDVITLPLLWLGLLVSLGGLSWQGQPAFADLRSAVIGAAAGYLVLWLMFHAFRLLTGKEGMGYGDFKLLGALGAWLGWQGLPLTILLSTAVGAVLGVVLIIAGKRERQTQIPFGPYLAAAGWIALLWGKDITHAYLAMSGLS